MKKITAFFREFAALFVIMLAPVSAKAEGGADFVFENPILKGNNKASIFDLVGAVMTFVTRIGLVIVIFMVVYSGFLFIKAQGDDSKITDAKNTFFWTVIGGVVLIGARVLAGVICNTAAGLGADVKSMCSGI